MAPVDSRYSPAHSAHPGEEVRRGLFAPPLRARRAELLEQGHGTPEDVAANFEEMWRLNRLTGGVRALTHHLYPRLAAVNGPVTLLDVGCGAADIAAAIAGRARRRGLDVQIVALDVAARHLDLALERARRFPEIMLLHADALHPPLPPGAVDYVISSLVLHHLEPPQVVELLGAAMARARRGVIMTDLVRGWLPLAAFRLTQPVLARSFLTRHDGALSIRRAYTPAELAGLARAAGLRGARVRTYAGWRMTLVADR